MEVRVTFGVPEDEELPAEDLDDIRGLVPDGRVTTEPGSVGVGGAAHGITVILEVAERVMNDFGSFVGLGIILREWIKRREKKGRSATISDSNAMGSIAASAIPESWQRELSFTNFEGSQPLFGRQPPPNWVGTDSRDMWVATFRRPGDATFVYLSPTGAVLGYVRIPFQTFFDGTDWVFRTDEHVAKLFAGWNLRS